MKPLKTFAGSAQIIFCDIDDTLTTDGKLHGEVYQSLWQLQRVGFQIVPVTGRPAGWCEMIARLWPVSGIIGENGAFYFRYYKKKMQRVFAVEDKLRAENQVKLAQIQKEVLSQMPGAALASDQFCRLFDLAIDFCEDVPALQPQEVEKIVSIFHRHGATAKVSSIHVNGWYGTYDKRTMCEIFYRDVMGGELRDNQEGCLFIGDSPNDEPLFAFFKNSFAVANIQEFAGQMKHLPTYVCEQKGGDGFLQFAEHLLGLKKRPR